MSGGTDDISMIQIAASGSLDPSNISLQTIYTSFINGDAAGNFALDDMASKDYPTVTTNAASSVTQTSMTCNGNVSGYGNITIGLQRGFYFGTSTNYASNTKVNAGGTGTGAYTLSRTSLTGGTTYYITAYALTAYGERQGSTVAQATTAPPSLTSFTAILPNTGGSNPVFGSAGAMCEAYEEGNTTNTIYYHDGDGATPTSGDDVYINSGGTTAVANGAIGMAVGRAIQNLTISGGTVSETPGSC